MSEVAREAWDALRDERASPFVSWAWLEALERSGCAAPDSGWPPRHLTLWRGERAGRGGAGLPAHRQRRRLLARLGLGGRRAPRRAALLPEARSWRVPFTPATRQRLLVAPRRGPAQLRARSSSRRRARWPTRRAARRSTCSSPTPRRARSSRRGLRAAGRLPVPLAQPRLPRRRATSSPRFSLEEAQPCCAASARAPARQGIAIRTVRGDELRGRARPLGRPGVRRFTRSTVDKLMWGRGWLNRAFYQPRLRDHARSTSRSWRPAATDKLIAGAFNVASGPHLYGRYWGCFEEHPFLHFNVCLYHSIDECIRRGLSVFEGGAGGEHKHPARLRAAPDLQRPPLPRRAARQAAARAPRGRGSRAPRPRWPAGRPRAPIFKATRGSSAAGRTEVQP